MMRREIFRPALDKSINPRHSLLNSLFQTAPFGECPLLVSLYAWHLWVIIVGSKTPRGLALEKEKSGTRRGSCMKLTWFVRVLTIRFELPGTDGTRRRLPEKDDILDSTVVRWLSVQPFDEIGKICENRVVRCIWSRIVDRGRRVCKGMVKHDIFGCALTG